MRTVKAVLFDMGETLVSAEPVSETSHKILKLHGVELPKEKIEASTGKAREKLNIDKMAKLGNRFWVEFNLYVLKGLGIKENTLPLAEAIDREWWEHANISLYPEVLEVLHKLKKKGLKVGIITNTLQADVEKVLSKLELTTFFDLVVSVDMAGKAKPSKEIFMYAAKRLELQPQEVLFVGDDLEIDYKGAKKAGFKALIIDRKNEVNQSVEKIKNLKEILCFLSL